MTRRGCGCCKNFNFMMIIIIDESSPYTDPELDTNNDGILQENYDRARELYDSDLEYLRETEGDIGQINMVVVHPHHFQDSELTAQESLVPPGRLFPEEVLQVYEDYIRFECNEDIFKDITNRHIRDKFSCIGVGIDDSGSTNSTEIFPSLRYWFWNLTDRYEDEQSPMIYQNCITKNYNNPFDDDTPVYVDPLPDCVRRVLKLNSSNGCVEVDLFSGERWLREAADVARRLFKKGCKKKTQEYSE